MKKICLGKQTWPATLFLGTVHSTHVTVHISPFHCIRRYSGIKGLIFAISFPMKVKMLKSELNFPLLTLYQLVQEINPISTNGFRLCLHNNTGTHGFSGLPTALIYGLLILGAYKVWQHAFSLVKGSFFSKYTSKIVILHYGNRGCGVFKGGVQN